MKKWIIEGLLFSLYLSFGLSWLAFVPLTAQLESHYHLHHAQVGMFISAVSLANAFVPLLAGWMGQRFGMTRSIGLGALACVSAILIPWIESFEIALVCRFLFGLGGAVVATLMGPMTMRLFEARQLAWINAWNNVSVNVGITLAMFATAPLANRWGWQNTLTVFAAVSLVAALIWWAISWNDPKEESHPSGEGNWKEVLATPATWWLTLGFIGPLGSYLALNTWLARALAENGMNPQQAQQVVVQLNLAGLPAAVVGGWATTRWGLRRPWVFLCGALLPLFLLALVHDPQRAWIWSSLAGFAFLFYVGAYFTIPLELEGATPASAGVMFGVILSVAYLATFLAPVAVGWLRDTTGTFALGLHAAALAPTTLLFAAAALPETGPARRRNA